MGLADFLISKRQQRLFAALFLHPERSYSASELIALSGAGKGAGQNQIDKLARAGVVTEERVGNQRRLRVNQEFPLYKELRSLCVKSFGVAEVLADALTPFANRIQRAFVFGSVAKETDRSSSDIDLLVVGDVRLLDVNRALAAAESHVGRSISLHLYAPAEWAQAQEDRVIKSILSGPLIEVGTGAAATAGN